MKQPIVCLLIDDDLDDQEIFLLCAQSIGYNIQCRMSNNGAEGIAMLEADADYLPDFIFLDINMPKMNGMETLQRIKKINRLHPAKVFMYSTSSETRVVEESIRLGANDFIVKPAKTMLLKERLKEIFGGTAGENADQ
jgi:CheY-like chemotaxis protein